MPTLRQSLLIALAAAVPSAVVADPPDDGEPPPPPGAVRIGSARFRPEAGWHKRAYFSADGATVVAPHGGKAVELWDPETGKRRCRIAVPDSSFRDTDYHAAGHLLALLGSREKAEDRFEAVLWLVDTDARRVARELPVPDAGRFNSDYVVRFTPDGKRLFLGVNGEIRVWDVKSGEELIRQKGKGVAKSFAVSPDGKTVAFGGYDLYLWDWQSGDEPRRFADGGQVGTEQTLFVAGGKTLLAAGRGDGRARLFDVATGRETGSFELADHMPLWSLSPDGKSLAVAGRGEGKGEQAVVLRDPVSGQVHGRIPTGRDGTLCPCWSPDGTRLAAVSGGRVRGWDVKTKTDLGPALPERVGHTAAITAFAFGPDGRLFTASDDNTVRSWDAATGKPGLTLTHKSIVRDVAVSPDGSLVAGSALSNDLRVWDAKTGAEKYRLLGNGRLGGRRLVRFTPDGGRLVAWGDDLFLRTWDLRTGKLLAEHRTLPGGVTEKQLEDDRQEMMLLGSMTADLSADAKTFVMCGYREVQVFDVPTGKETAKFEADAHRVSAFGLSPDGTRLAVAGGGKQVETRLPDGGTRHSLQKEHTLGVWSIAEKKPLWQATVPGGGSHGFVFSSDGRRLAQRSRPSGEEVTPVVLRDAADGKELGRLDVPKPGWHLAFDRGGKNLAVSHNDTTATVYDLDVALKPIPPK